MRSFGLSTNQVNGIPGLAVIATGRGLSDTSLAATPPLNPWLGNLTMWIEERKVPVLSVTPDGVRFLVPWDLAKSPARIRAEVPGVHSPFDFPESTITTFSYPTAGAIAHQNWDGPVDCCTKAPRAGEIIHVWAIGLGAVTPEVPVGTTAPLAPLSRLALPLLCTGSEVLFTGLAPGYVERIYQIDLRLGSATAREALGRLYTYAQSRANGGTNMPKNQWQLSLLAMTMECLKWCPVTTQAVQAT
jgi:uncharacterized protein (TIGR03437 family)